MPVLKNPRHELFAQALAGAATADEAYVEAGYKQNRGNATTLKAKQSVRDRVAEILGNAAKRSNVTIESLGAELEEARRLALRKSAPSAAVQSTMGKAKVYGFLVDKVNITGTLTLEQLVEQSMPDSGEAGEEKDAAAQ